MIQEPNSNMPSHSFEINQNTSFPSQIPQRMFQDAQNLFEEQILDDTNTNFLVNQQLTTQKKCIVISTNLIKKIYEATQKIVENSLGFPKKPRFLSKQQKKVFRKLTKLDLNEEQIWKLMEKQMNQTKKTQKKEKGNLLLNLMKKTNKNIQI